MTDVGRALVHIGTHKTGTTSFQRWAEANREELLVRTKMLYFEGRFGENHLELALACIRRDRSMPSMREHPEWCLEDWQEDTRHNVSVQSFRWTGDLLLSAEGMSYVRHGDEVETLVRLLRPRAVSVVAVLRDPASFLESYRQELLDQGFELSRDPQSFAYVEEDSWLARYDELIAAYAGVLGPEHVHTVGYEESLDRYGSTIPAILEQWGADPQRLPRWDDVQENVTERFDGVAR